MKKNCADVDPAQFFFCVLVRGYTRVYVTEIAVSGNFVEFLIDL